MGERRSQDQSRGAGSGGLSEQSGAGGAGSEGLSGQSSPPRPDSSERTTPAAHAGDEPEGTTPAPAADESPERLTPAGASAPASSSPSGKEEGERVERDLGELLENVERERDEYLELARRTKADFENYRRRVAGESAEAEKRGRAALARDILPVIDNLERALAASGENRADRPQADDRASGGATAGSSLAEGVRLVREELAGVLRRSGVESYEPQGESFDPHLHEAMMARPAECDQAGKVLEVLEKGYRLDGQVLRPARVVVGSGEEKQPSEGKASGGSEHMPSGGKPPAGSEHGPSGGKPPAGFAEG